MSRLPWPLAIGLALALATVLRADSLLVRLEDETPARLVLPATVVKEYAKKEALREQTPPTGLSSLVAGLALSIAFVLGGLWLARRVSPRALAGTAACACAGLLLLSSSCSKKDAHHDEFDPIRHTLTRHRRESDRRYDRFRSAQRLALYHDESDCLKGEVLLEEASGSEDSLKLIVERGAIQELADATSGTRRK